MAYPTQKNQIQQALDRLLTQWQGKPNIEGLLTAFMQEIQLLEDISFDMLEQRSLDVAVGKQLDVVGKIVGLAREGRTDAEYRQALYERVAVNRSDGSTEIVIELMKFIAQADAAYLFEHFPASNILYVPRACNSRLVPILNDLVSAGVEAHLMFDLEDDSFIPADTTAVAKVLGTNELLTVQTNNYDEDAVEVLLNATFDGDVTDWAVTGTGSPDLSYLAPDAYMVLVADGTGLMVQDVTLDEYKYYILSVTLEESDLSGETAAFFYDGVTNSKVGDLVVGENIFVYKATGDETQFRIGTTIDSLTGESITINSVSLKAALSSDIEVIDSEITAFEDRSFLPDLIDYSRDLSGIPIEILKEIGLGKGLGLGLGGAYGFESPTWDFTNAIDVLDLAISGTRSSEARYWDSTGTLQNVNPDTMRGHAFQDYNPVTGEPRGLLIERAETNSIRNPRFIGAVPGVLLSGGTAPTYMAIGGNGLTISILDVFQDKGMDVMRVRFTGTPTGSAFISLEQTIGIIWENGQTITRSIHLALAGGSLDNVSTISCPVRMYTADGVTYLGDTAGTLTNLAPDLTGELKQFKAVGTASNASTGRAFPLVRIGLTNGLDIDLTLDLALPQVVVGGFSSTSPILPEVGQIGISSRAADSLTVNDVSTMNFNQSEGTFYWEGALNVIPTVGYLTPILWNFSGRNGPERIAAYVSPNDQKIRCIVVNNGVTQAVLGSSYVVQQGEVFKVGFSWKENSFRMSVNGTGVAEVTSGVVPVVDKLWFGRYITTGYELNGWCKRSEYEPAQATQLQLDTWTS